MPVLLIAVVVSLSQVPSVVRAFDADAAGQTYEALTLPQLHAQAESKGDSELPWLFAVFMITWAAFFAYVFVMSRRQREMGQEIEALKEALTVRGEKGQESGPGAEPPAS